MNDSLGILVMKEHLDLAAAWFLRIAVRARVNILVTGPRNVNKIQLLNALGDIVPEAERMIVIESKLPLDIGRTNTPVWYANSSKDKIDLIQTAVNMQTDRIIMSEIRGDEIEEYLEILSKGHNGGMSTYVSDDAKNAIERLAKLMPVEDHLNLPHYERMLQQIVAASLEVIISIIPSNNGWMINTITEVSINNKMEIIYRHLFERDSSTQVLQCLKFEPKFDEKRKRYNVRESWYEQST
ncbi:ATPase, T2SS/T4P/T4SS family [Paenibacillus sp. Leaf72]|uniref:ATPase, T2SS/T4P/T4SS family n=1 Tax=Paenibacillus sp. Leaf72 TaxID=1736234 RepID=UPI0007010CB4|nr:ATPase, T2SS/T4P/T4SS family [Paenibacillus sp. Leaf72]KQN96958.1 hypothetical protein ASF12_23090 [Paenibacillus sp. Leaf72]